MADLHLYGEEYGWIAGGPVLPEVCRTEAIKRVAAAVRDGFRGICRGVTSKPTRYRWAGEASDRPLPTAALDDKSGPVFAGDARDRHLSLLAEAGAEGFKP